MASTQHALRTSRASLRSAKQTRTQFANSPKYKYKVPEVQVSKIQVFYGQVRTRIPFKHRKCYSPTSRQARVLVLQASVAAYLQDYPSRFFSYDSLNARKQRIHTDELHTRATFQVSSTKNSFFWFTSSGVHKQPILIEVLAPASLFIRGSHVRRQYRKRTTLRSKISTIKGLLYAPEPHNRKKGTLSDQPRLSHVSSMALLCCWGRSCSKIWHPSWLTLRRMPYGKGKLKILLRRIS